MSKNDKKQTTTQNNTKPIVVLLVTAIAFSMYAYAKHQQTE